VVISVTVSRAETRRSGALALDGVGRRFSFLVRVAVGCAEAIAAYKAATTTHTVVRRIVKFLVCGGSVVIVRGSPWLRN
jgi:hypothetical protein